MKKKVRVLVPKIVKDTINQDCKFWGITKERLCNEILFNFSLKSNTNYREEMIFEEKEYLQLNLNKTNQAYYLDLLEKSDTTNESEVLRNIFLSYARLIPFLREIYLFKERIIFLKSVNKEARILKLDTPLGVIEGKIEKLFRCEKTDYLKIKINEEQFFIGEVRVLN